MGWFTIFHVEVMKKFTSILRLGKEDSFFGLQHFETNKIMQMSQVWNFKILFKTGFHMGYKYRVTTSKDKIINIKNKYDVGWFPTFLV